MAYGIGLDCGTTSVGFAVLQLDNEGEPCRIIRLGSRIFKAAEHPKTGASLAAPRREKRSLRRLVRRHRHRNERIRNLLVSEGLIGEDQLGRLFDGQLSDIYELRTAALDKRLSDTELARVLIHLAQRRGFKSNRKNPAGDAEAGKLLSAVSQNIERMQKNGYRTVGEMLFKDAKFADTKRNKGENYANTVSRAMVEDEIHAVFDAQRRWGNKKATAELEEQYTAIVLSQRSFEEGPGGNSPYGGNQIEKMMGTCTLIPEEQRAVKASYSFQLFTLWQKINHLRIVCQGDTRALTDEERKLIFEAAHKKATLKYADIRKVLSLSDEDYFNCLNYADGTEKAENKSFNFLTAYHEIRKALNRVSKNRIQDYSKEQLNAIGYIFTVYKTEDKIRQALAEQGISEIDMEELLTLGNFSKVGHVSVKACEALLPYLEQGMIYNEACDAAGFSFRGHEREASLYLPAYSPELEDLTNPVVKRTVSQTVKVINAIIREQGESPTYINIELARELAKTKQERTKDQRYMEDNQRANERRMERIKTEFGLSSPTGMDIVKLRLWEEQDGVCPYSMKKIEIGRLFESGYAEVDHIVPYSISFDDSYKNKVLVLTAENRQKGGRLPLEYLTGNRREAYLVWVNTHVKNYRKKQLMLKDHISQEDRDNQKARSLQDTQYISRFLYNYIRDHMAFAPSNRNRKVTAVNGAVTAYMRKRWGISKIREDGDLHHAADAVVVACTTDGLIQKVSRYNHYKEIEYSDVDEREASYAVHSRTGEVIEHFPYPWPNFRKELEIRLSNCPQTILEQLILTNYTSEEQAAVKPCLVSRMPTRKISGPAHKDTVRRLREVDGREMLVSKRPLTELKLDANGEIKGYYNPASDRLLYEALKARLTAFDGNGEKAFAEPFYKPTSTGKPGPLVKKVKLYEPSSLPVAVHQGTGRAENDTMVRIDVFYVEGEGYYMVPIYVADTVKDSLPNKAVVAGKPYSEWKEMDDDRFVFSLYPNDLIRVQSKRDIKMSLDKKFQQSGRSSLPLEHIAGEEEYLYYVKASISTASITVETHDGAYTLPSLGIKTLLGIQKFEVDPLGECHPVGWEPRRGFRK